MPKRAKKATKKSPGFFHSNYVKLLIVFLLAAAIPLTVMSVQQVQNVQQEAASTPKAGKDCSAAAGSDIIATPLAPELGQTITFKRASGSFSQDDFDFKIPLGNGVDSNKCTFSNGVIKDCPTKKGTTKDITVDGKKLKGTVHTIAENGTSICEYYVVLKESKPAPTKDTTKPTKDPNKPTATPNAAKKCQANLSAGSCTGDNKPRLRASWNMNDEGTCSVKVGGVEISTDCSNSNKDIVELGGKALENGKTYDIAIKNSGSCNSAKAASATAPTCNTSTPGTPTTTTPTPKTTTTPGTNSPTPSANFGTPESIKATCAGTKDNPQLKVYAYNTPQAASYIVRLRTTEGGSVVKEATTTKTEVTISGIALDKNYYYSAIAIDSTGKKSGETKSNNDRRIKCTTANYPTQGAASAMDIISDIWAEMTTTNN